MSSLRMLRRGAGLEDAGPAIHRALIAPAYALAGDRLADQKHEGCSRVLECGCGTGNGLIQLGRRLGPAFALTGIDVEPRFIRYARKQNRQEHIRFGLADARELPFPSDHFDFVFCVFSIIHNLPQAQAVCALSEMLRVLKPGALLLFTTPDHAMSQELYHPNPGEEARLRFSRLNVHEYRRDELRDLLGAITAGDAAFGPPIVGGLYNDPFAMCWRSAIQERASRAFAADGAQRVLARVVRRLLPQGVRVRCFLRLLEAKRRELGVSLDAIERAGRYEATAPGEPLHFVVTATKERVARNA